MRRLRREYRLILRRRFLQDEMSPLGSGARAFKRARQLKTYWQDRVTPMEVSGEVQVREVSAWRPL